MVQLLLVTLLGILVFPLIKIQSIELNSPFNNNNEDNVDEYEEYQYEDGEPYSYPDFGLKNTITKLSTTNTLDDDDHESTKTTKSNSFKIKPSITTSTTTTTTTKKITKPTTTTIRSIPPSKRPKYTRRPITFIPTATSSSSPSQIVTTIQTERPFTIHTNDHHNQNLNTLLIPFKRTPVKRKRIPSIQSIYKNDKLKNFSRNSTANYSKFNENDDNDSNDSLEKSESNYAPNKYKFDSTGSGSGISSDSSSSSSEESGSNSNESYEPHPYNEYSLYTYHYEDSKPKQPTSNEEHYLFTTDMHAPKYSSQENNFGYFKSTGKYKDNFEPVHGDFKTDLSVSAIKLESYPIKLKSFSQKQPNVQSQEVIGYSSNEDYHHYRYKPSSVPITAKPTTISPLSSEEVDPDLLSFYHYQSSTTRRPVTQYSSVVAITPGVASKDQIKLYNDDQKGYYESIIEHQLRSSTNLADKAKLHQFLKAQEDEKIEQQTKREQNNNRHHNNYQPNFYLTYHSRGNNNNNNQYPSTFYHHPHHTNLHPHHPPYPQKPLFRKSPERPKQTPGLRHFRTPSSAPALGKQKSVPVLSDRSYNFPFI